MAKKNWLYSISTWIISLFLANGGITAIKEYPQFWPSGVSLVIAAFLMVYFSSYTSQINKSQEDIKKCWEEISNIKKNEESKEKLLNTLRDIVLLNKISKIK